MIYINEVILNTVRMELDRARSIFPNPGLLTTAFSEEAGELVKAILDNFQGKRADVYSEAIQTIAMVVRLLEEGDPIHRLAPISTLKENQSDHGARERITVDAEEWEELNHAFNHARNYIASDRQEGREWKGWTLDEFDSACERIDFIRDSCWERQKQEA